jgi:PRTRC genetic system ThiF family protein
LINRVNLFWGLRWQAHPEHFHKDSLRANSAGPHLIISCVDTRAARQAIVSAVTRTNDSTTYWLDLGNNASSGQYVLGQPLNAANRRSAARLRTVAELYPEIVDAEAGEDPLPSCSAAEALERQEPFINQVLATSALAMLARLFRYGTLTHHGAFYNAQTGRMAALPADPQMWARMRRRDRRANAKHQAF